jgi:tRNA G18 (ribose-2'-O)-methylase SpoU
MFYLYEIHGITFYCFQPHPNGSGSDKLAKSALGAEMMVPSRHFSTTRQAIEYIRLELSDYELIGMETTDQSRSYTDVKYSSKVALVLGNEVTGVDTELLVGMQEGQTCIFGWIVPYSFTHMLIHLFLYLCVILGIAGYHC